MKSTGSTCREIASFSREIYPAAPIGDTKRFEEKDNPLLWWFAAVKIKLKHKNRRSSLPPVCFLVVRSQFIKFTGD